MQVLRLASELIQRAKSGALLFDASLRMTLSFLFIEIGGGSGGEMQVVSK